ncbi:zinc finger protein 40-like [Heterodontus francisci]|uniref:zinc finger protein 40-like n=1 Tax=Heterodontus francisci TaxID=7792 RepID=UPI00355BB9A8
MAKNCYIPPDCTMRDLHASHSATACWPQIQNGNEPFQPSPHGPNAGLQPSPHGPGLQPSPHGPGLQLSPHGPGLQPSPHGPGLQPSPHGPGLQPSPHEPGLQPSPQGPCLQPSPHGPGLQPSPHGPGLQPSPHGPGLQPSPHGTNAGLQPSPHGPGLQPSPHGTNAGLQPSPHGTNAGLQPSPHGPGLQPSPHGTNAGLQPSPHGPGLQPSPHGTNAGLQPSPHGTNAGLQPSPHGPGLQPSPHGTNAGLQPSPHGPRLQPSPHGPNAGLQPSPHGPGPQPSPHGPGLQPSPHGPGLQPSPHGPGIQPSPHGTNAGLQPSPHGTNAGLQPSPHGTNAGLQPSPHGPWLEPSPHGPGLQLAPDGTGQTQYPTLVNMNQIKVKKQGKYVCIHCGRDCSKPSVLEKHVRSHTGERPFPCTTCGISFKTQSNLYKHKRTQTHVNNCRLLAELERSTESGPSSDGLSLSHVDHGFPRASMHQDSEQNRGRDCHCELPVPNATSMDHSGHQGFPGGVHWGRFWSRNSTAEKRENDMIDGEKQNVQPQEDQIGSRHMVLQRQQATYFAKQWIHKSSSSSVQTNESTDSGYFSHSDTADHQLYSSSSLQSFHQQSTDIEPVKASQSSQHLVSAEQNALGSVVGDISVRGMDRRQLGKQELGERISKLISDNKAVVDDKQLENVRPRKTVISKQGSIDLPMPYTFKDSFHFDMKSIQVNKRTNLSSNLTKSISPSPGKLQQMFLSSPFPVTSTVDCLPVIRSNSMPPGEGSVSSSKIANSSTSYFEKQNLQRNSSVALHTESSQSRSLDFHPSHHRTLVRQTALEVVPASGSIVYGSNPVGEGNPCVEQASKNKHKSLEKKNSQKKLTKFSHERWSIYGEETFRKKYQEVKRTISPVEPILQRANQFTQIGTMNPDTVLHRDISALSEDPHISSLASPSTHKTPVRKHFSDPLILGSVKVTMFNSQMFQTDFLQKNVDKLSLEQANPTPCHNVQETKTPLSQDCVWEVTDTKTSSSAEVLNVCEGLGNMTSPHAARETSSYRVKGLSPHQLSSTSNTQKENGLKRPMQRQYSHPKLVRQLSILLPESKTVQESIKARKQQKNEPEGFSLQQGNDGVSEFPSEKPPKKKQKLKLADIGHATEKLQFGIHVPVTAVPGQSSQSDSILDSASGHGHLQVINSTKQDEKGSTSEGYSSPNVCSSYTGLEQALFNRSKSCLESLATSSPSPPLQLVPHSEGKTQQREDSEAVMQRGLPSLLDTARVQANQPDKIIHIGPHMPQCVTPVPPQVKNPHFQNQHFLPKYQLKWAKENLVRPHSALTAQAAADKETTAVSDAHTCQWAAPRTSHHTQHTAKETVQPLFTSYKTSNEVQQTDRCETSKYPFTISDDVQFPSGIPKTAVVTNLIHLMNKRFQQPIGSQSVCKLQNVHWTAVSSLERSSWTPVCDVTHSLVGQCQQGASNVKLSGQLASKVATSECEHLMCISGSQRSQQGLQWRPVREQSSTIPLEIQGLVVADSEHSSFQKMNTQPNLTWCYLRKTVPLHALQKDKATSVYATWSICEKTSEMPSLALKDTFVVHRLQQKGQDTYVRSIDKLQTAVHPHSRQRLVPQSLVNAQGRRRCRGSKYKCSSSSGRGHKVGELYETGHDRGKHMCKECGICCKKPSTLKTHLQTHTNVRPYHCKLCDRSFKTKGNLTKHVKSKIHSKKPAKAQVFTSSEGQEPAEEDQAQILNGKQQVLKSPNSQAHMLASSAVVLQPTELQSKVLIESTPLSNVDFSLHQSGEALVTSAVPSSSMSMIVSALVPLQSPLLPECSTVARTSPVSECSVVSLCSPIPVWSLPQISAMSQLQNLSTAKNVVHELTSSHNSTVSVLPVVSWAAIPEQSNNEALPYFQTLSASNIANSKAPETSHSVNKTSTVGLSSGSGIFQTAGKVLSLPMERRRRPSESIKDQVLQSTEALQSQTSYEKQPVLLSTCSGKVHPGVGSGTIQLLQAPECHSQSSSPACSCHLQICALKDARMTSSEAAQPSILLLPAGLPARILHWLLAVSTIPTVPTDPAAPTGPTDPAAPTGPTDPAAPTGPTDPAAPTGPTDPAAPTGPTDPAAPTGPTDPAAPTGPTDPAAPTGPTDPAAPTGPTDLAAPAGPTDPAVPTGPSNPAAPTVPTDPAAPTGPTDPAAPTVPTDPVAPTGPTDPATPTGPADPAAPTGPTDPAAPTVPTDPAAPIDLSDPTAPTSHSDPAAPTGPSDPTAPTDPSDPTMSSDPRVPTEPTVNISFQESLSGLGVDDGQGWTFRQTVSVQNTQSVKCIRPGLTKLENTGLDSTEPPVTVTAAEFKHSESLAIDMQKFLQQMNTMTPPPSLSGLLDPSASRSSISEAGAWFWYKESQCIDGKKNEGTCEAQELPNAALTQMQRRGKSLEMTIRQQQVENEESSSDEDRLIIETE